MITYGHSSPSSLSSTLSSSLSSLSSSQSSSHNWVVVVTPQQRDNWNISRGQIGFPNSPKCDHYSISKPCNSNYQNHYHSHDDHMTMWSCDLVFHMKRNQWLLLLFWLSSPVYPRIWWTHNAIIPIILTTLAEHYINCDIIQVSHVHLDIDGPAMISKLTL